MCVGERERYVVGRYVSSLDGRLQYTSHNALGSRNGGIIAC